MKRTFDPNVEALRGFCALMVIIFHTIAFDYMFDPGFSFKTRIIAYAPPGYFVVLIFFMLSGYVIGLTSLNTIFNTWDYLKRRAVRIYPIYLFAIALTAIFFSEKWQSVLGAVFFTQNLFTVVPLNNLSIWSLNHEIIYYLLAIPILKFRIPPVKVFAVLILLLCLSLVKLQFPLIIEGYLIGFIFWFSGFAVSKVKLSQPEIPALSNDKLIALFLLLLCCDFLNAFQINRVLSKVHLLHGPERIWLDDMVKLSDFSGYPFALYAIATVACIKANWYKILTVFVYALCWIRLLFVVANGSFFKIDVFYLPAVFLVLSTLLLIFKTKIFKSTSFWAYIGSVSYALYVIHMPILELIGKINFFRGTFLSFIFRDVLLFLIVLGISHLLERVIQPKIKAFFTPGKVQKVIIN